MTTQRSLDIGVFGARSVPSTYSGYETFLTTLLPELVERGHRVTMYCRRGEVEGDGDYLGVRRVVLPAIPGKQFNTLSHGLLASIRARFARHDVVLAVNVANALFCAVHRYSGSPIVLNTDGQEWLRGKWGTAARGFFKFSAKSAGKCATALVSDCNAMHDVYRDDFRASSTVIPYCVPASALEPRPEMFERLGVTPREYFVVAARLNPENNVDAIAAAYSKSDLPLPLLVLGAANYQSPVERNLAEVAERDPRVRVIGHVADRSEFFSLLGSARAYLHGHSVGGMNPSLVEAMHAGARVAALDTAFNRETISGTGSFFEVARLADALQAVLDEPAPESERLRAAARCRAAEEFSTPAVVGAYESLLLAAAAAPARRLMALPTHWSERR